MRNQKRIPKEYLGAFKSGHRRGVREYIDEDFSFQLLQKAESGDVKALEALKWVTKYNNETYRGVLKKNDPNSLHNTPELYKDACDGHNQRRRDTMCVIKSGNPGAVGVNLGDNPGILNEARLLNYEDTLISLVSPQISGILATAKGKPPKKPKS